MKLDQQFIQAVRPAIMQVWNYIGADSYACAQECGERLTNEAALEGCIDADRIATLCKKPEVDALIGEAIKEHGYGKVMASLKRNIRLT